MPELSRSLQQRHITMISIGGIIGAGLFVGSSASIAATGPAIVLSYLITGTLVLLVMRMLGEMAVALPTVRMTSRAARSPASWPPSPSVTTTRAVSQQTSRSDQEYYRGDVTIAAPVLGEDGQPLAAVNISAPTSRWTLAQLRAKLAPLLLHSAQAASLGHTPRSQRRLAR